MTVKYQLLTVYHEGEMSAQTPEEFAETLAYTIYKQGRQDNPAIPYTEWACIHGGMVEQFERRYQQGLRKN